MSALEAERAGLVTRVTSGLSKENFEKIALSEVEKLARLPHNVRIPV